MQKDSKTAEIHNQRPGWLHRLGRELRSPLWLVMLSFILLVQIGMWSKCLRPQSQYNFISLMIILVSHITLIEIVFMLSILFYAKRSWPALLTFLVCIALFIILFNKIVPPFLEGFLGILSYIAYFSSILLVAYYARKLNTRGFVTISRLSLSFFLLLISCFPPIAVNAYAIGKLSDQVRPQVQPIIEKINTYYIDYKNYPEELEDIGYKRDVPLIPEFQTRLSYKNYGTYYRLNISYPVNLGTYDSRTQKWE